MTNTDKCYAVMEVEAINISVDAKEHAGVDLIGNHLRKLMDAYSDLQVEEYENRIKATGEVC